MTEPPNHQPTAPRIAKTNSSPIRFAEFEVDLAGRRLLREGQRVALQEKPFQLLEALLSRPGAVRSREELSRELWPEASYLEFDANLNVAVQKLRRALDDSASDPRWLFTVTGEGYRLNVDLNAGLNTGLNAEQPHTTPEPLWPIVATAATLLLLVAVSAWGRWGAGASPREPIRVAIMPFELAGEEHPVELAKVSEWLLAEFSGRGPELQVIGPRSTAPYSQFPFPDPEKLRSELKADLVLNARTVEKKGDPALIIELIDLHDRSHPWAKFYPDPWNWRELAMEVCVGVLTEVLPLTDTVLAQCEDGMGGERI